MKNTTDRVFPVDNASILFLSLIRPYHTNSFRFSMTMKDPVSPEALQEAVNRIHRRFPSVIAGVQQGFFAYRQVAASDPPTVQPDPGLLKPMTKEELHNCCFRVYYKENVISLEVFHALTDGYGTITTFTTLAAEYLNILHDITVPVGLTRLDASEEPQREEIVDSFLDMTEVPPRHLPSRFSYLPDRPDSADWQVRGNSLTLDTKPLLDAAHRYGITLNTLLTTVLADAIMELQLAERAGKKLKPVRIMIPVDLRRMMGSRTLRNFSLYTIPTLEGHQHPLSFQEKCRIFDTQLKQQLSKENLSAMVSYNVRTQNAWYFKISPWKLKSLLLRIGYRFFGESNSSLTLTNLGIVRFPQELMEHVENFQCWLTPRVSSPYGCTVMSLGNQITLTMSRFTQEDKLGPIFFGKLKAMVEN